MYILLFLTYPFNNPFEDRMMYPYLVIQLRTFEAGEVGKN